MPTSPASTPIVLLRISLAVAALACAAAAGLGLVLIASDLASHDDDWDGLGVALGAVLLVGGVAFGGGLTMMLRAAARAPRGVAIAAVATGVLLTLAGWNVVGVWGPPLALPVTLVGVAQVASAVAVLRSTPA